MLMPGENIGAADGPYLSYLRALQSWDERFPGFGHDTHGVENIRGTYHIYCLKQPQRMRGVAHEGKAVTDEHAHIGAR
jgi:arginine/lysine/ornithine decarboxylase